MKRQIINGSIKLGTTNYLITNSIQLKFEIYSFIRIVANNFSLQPYVVERIEYIFKEVWKKHTTFFNTIPYENAVIGVMILANEEFCSINGIDYIPIDVKPFVEQLYGAHNVQKNIIQIYTVYQNVKDIFKWISTFENR